MGGSERSLGVPHENKVWVLVLRVPCSFLIHSYLSDFFVGLQINCAHVSHQMTPHTCGFYYGRLFKVELLCAIHYLKFVVCFFN